MPDSIIKADNISSLSGGGVGFPNGSVSNPSMKFTNDSDTGLYRIGNNTIGISTGGNKVGEIGNGYGGFTGNVIQVVTNNTNVQKTVTSTTYITSGLSCSITPKYNTSKILIMYSSGSIFSDSATQGFQFKLYKNGSELIGNYGDVVCYSNAGNIGTSYSNMFLDSPNTVSSTTYELFFNRRGAAGTNYFNYSNSFANMILLEVQQ